MMKRIWFLSFLLIFTGGLSLAKTPQTESLAQRPATQLSTARAQTTQQVFRPVTERSSQRPVTEVSAFRPSTQAVVSRPQSETVISRPTTEETVSRPSTTVEVFHPQTDVESLHFQTMPAANSGNSTGGKSVSSSAQAVTSMSNFQPKPAKDLTAGNKAAPLGGGSMNLGNADSDQAAKDAAAKASLLGAQNNQNLDVDPRQNKLSGLEKKVTDRSKIKNKQP